MSAAWAPYFTVEEMRCPCCHRADMDKDFMHKLWSARRACGVVMPVSSGYRCIHHNKAVKGAKESWHLKGRAADITCLGGVRRAAIVRALMDEGLSVIIYRTHVHADLRPMPLQLGIAL